MRVVNVRVVSRDRRSRNEEEPEFSAQYNVNKPYWDSVVAESKRSNRFQEQLLSEVQK